MTRRATEAPADVLYSTSRRVTERNAVRASDFTTAQKRLVLGLLLIISAAMTGLCLPQERARPMNIVLLVSDDQRDDSLGAAGNPIVQTPRLDRLAAQGVRFTNAFVTSSICMTSRASILTGQYMSRHEIDRFGKPLTPGQFAETYAGLLREAGYWTGFVGKYGVGSVRLDDFDFIREYAGRHWFEVDGERLHVTERNARDSIVFLENRPRDKPFVLSVSYFAPHAEDGHRKQYLPQDWSAVFYEDVTVPHSSMMDASYLEALPPFLRDGRNEGRIRFHRRFDTPERYQRYMINYYRLITEVDEAVGRIVEKLKEQEVYENTLIIFIADNGYIHGERGLADKWYPYEESIRVPLILFDPRLPRDRRGFTREQTALNIDVAPTIVAAAGLQVPEAMQGEDLSALYLAPRPSPWRDEFFYEHPTITDKRRIPTSHAVVRRDLKYVHWPEWDYEQLFDLRRDPTEKDNLVEDPAYTDALGQMREKLVIWRGRAR